MIDDIGKHKDEVRNSILNADMPLLYDLQLRRRICIGIIKFLEDECADDPRQPDAIEEYKRQLAEIELRIAGSEDTGTLLGEKPSPIVVGLHTAILYGRSNIKE